MEINKHGQRATCCLQGFCSSHIAPSWPLTSGYSNPVSWVCAGASVAIQFESRCPAVVTGSLDGSTAAENLSYMVRISQSLIPLGIRLCANTRRPGGSPPFLRRLLPWIWETRGHEQSLSKFRSPSLCGSQHDLAFSCLLGLKVF